METPRFPWKLQGFMFTFPSQIAFSANLLESTFPSLIAILKLPSSATRRGEYQSEGSFCKSFQLNPIIFTSFSTAVGYCAGGKRTVPLMVKEVLKSCSSNLDIFENDTWKKRVATSKLLPLHFDGCFTVAFVLQYVGSGN